MMINDFFDEGETPSGPVGYLAAQYLRRNDGVATVPIKVRSFTYSSHSHAFSDPDFGTVTIGVQDIASDTIYRSEGGLDAQATTYDYTYHSGGNASEVSFPKVLTGQNGPGTAAAADEQTTFFDTYGRPVWLKDAGNSLYYTSYEPGTNSPNKLITDVNPSDPARAGDYSGKPAAWATPSGGGLHLLTAMAVDDLGRTTKLTDPNASVTYVVYKDAQHEMRVYPGWSCSGNSGSTTGPIEASREYRPVSGVESTLYYEALTTTATPGASSGTPTGIESITGGNIASLARELTNNAGQTTEVHEYFATAGLTYSDATVWATAQSSNNTASGNYHKTAYGYDRRGRLDRVMSPNSTVGRTVFDGLGRATSTWVGTDDVDDNPVGRTVYWSCRRPATPSSTYARCRPRSTTTAATARSRGRPSTPTASQTGRAGTACPTA